MMTKLNLTFWRLSDSYVLNEARRQVRHSFSESHEGWHIINKMWWVQLHVKSCCEDLQLSPWLTWQAIMLVGPFARDSACLSYEWCGFWRCSCVWRQSRQIKNMQSMRLRRDYNCDYSKAKVSSEQIITDSVSQFFVSYCDRLNTERGTHWDPLRRWDCLIWFWHQLRIDKLTTQWGGTCTQWKHNMHLTGCVCVTVARVHL